MLFLVFRLGNDRYAIEATQVVEVLPLVNWKCVPRAPAGVARQLRQKIRRSQKQDRLALLLLTIWRPSLPLYHTDSPNYAQNVVCSRL